MIEKFLKQDEELEAFLTGPAGSGKTTALIDIVKKLNELKVNYKIVAYTHKAKDVLISKLPKDTDITTLHSWLKKRPGINEKAKHIRALMTTRQLGKPEILELLIVDEYSFIGEKDYMSIGDLQDPLMLETIICNKCGKELDEYYCADCEDDDYTVENNIKPLKVLYVGDLNQLSPVDGPSAVEPHEPFWVQLTKIHRTTTTISKPLAKLVKMIEGDLPMKYLEATEHFIRGVDIDTLYKNDANPDKIMLAYTNKAVQEHNAAIQGYKEPKIGDTVYCPTLKRDLVISNILSKYDSDCMTPNGIINSETRFNPLKLLNSLKDVKFYVTEDNLVVPGIFGSYNNKQIREKLGKDLVAANKAGKDSKKLYRKYKTISDYVSILDFAHCMTIHKSQGSEFDNVYVDSKDLSKCINKQERMKLLYVAMSRSKNKIFLNN